MTAIICCSFNDMQTTCSNYEVKVKALAIGGLKQTNSFSHMRMGILLAFGHVAISMIRTSVPPVI